MARGPSVGSSVFALNMDLMSPAASTHSSFNSIPLRVINISRRASAVHRSQPAFRIIRVRMRPVVSQVARRVILVRRSAQPVFRVHGCVKRIAGSARNVLVRAVPPRIVIPGQAETAAAGGCQPARLIECGDPVQRVVCSCTRSQGTDQYLRVSDSPCVSSGRRCQLFPGPVRLPRRQNPRVPTRARRREPDKRSRRQ